MKEAQGGGGFGGFGGGMNMEDIFSQFGDIFGGGGFGGFEELVQEVNCQARVKGSNLRIRVKLSLEEIALGVDKESERFVEKYKQKVSDIHKLFYL